MASIDTVVSDIQKLFNDGCTLNHSCVERFSEAIGVNFKERFEEYKTKKKPYLRLSNYGKPLRQLWFEIASGLDPEPLSPSTKLKFAYGDLVEDFILMLAIEAGHDVTRIQEKVSVDDVPGTIDCFIDGWLVDIKSASTYSFNKFKDGTLRDQDPFGYVGQLAGYSCACGGVDGAFLAVDKTLGHLCLLKFSKEELAAYEVGPRINEARGALAASQPPEDYCYDAVPDGKSGNLKLPVGCSYCSHKWNCRKDLRAFSYSTGPVYLTKVERLPNVPEFYNNSKKKEGNLTPND